MCRATVGRTCGTPEVVRVPGTRSHSRGPATRVYGAQGEVTKVARCSVRHDGDAEEGREGTQGASGCGPNEYDV